MNNKDSLLKELDNCVFNLTDEEYEELADSIDGVFIIRKMCYNLSTTEDSFKINYFNKVILIYLSSLGNNYIHTRHFLEKADNTIWNYILKYFDDEKLHSRIVIIYLCMINIPIQTEFIIKVFKILF